jgi:radical SAM protein with 4Fe4S-binding SPASM domain
MNFDQAPMLVIWEVTQACDLACVHCRASAQSERHPKELTTEQGYRLLDQIKSFGDPLMVFTGGDPLKRPDLTELLRYSVKIGLRTNVTPSATPLLTEQAIDGFKAAGVSRMAISVDGHDAASHDDFRGVPGTFDRAMAALRHARDIGLDTQFQTTVTRRNMAHLPEIAEIVKDMRSKMWSLFFLIVTGRALADDDLMAPEYEQVFKFMYELSKNESARDVAFRTAGVSDGKGFVFVSHQGEIYPSGFLPITGGNVLNQELTDVYRNSDLFKKLRDTGAREGKCGVCEYQKICGGSRSRAYALTGDFLASDPRCIYQPQAAEALVG